MHELNFISPHGGPPPTRFIGVVRIREHKYDLESEDESNIAEYKNKFGVEFPEFSPMTQIQSEDMDESLSKPFIPSIASCDKRSIVLRADIDQEEVAGRLYSFVYRILYGLRAAEKIRSFYNTSHAFHNYTDAGLDKNDSKNVIEINDENKRKQ